MKKILSIFMIFLLILGLSGCNKTPKQPETPAQNDPPEVKDYVEFREEAAEMTPGDAQAYLQSEDADPTSVQYKEAVYTVNETAAEGIINEARDQEVQTEEVKTLFEGVFFKFLEGDQFASETVDRKIFARGTYELGEDGWYRFTFYDRTLAQAAVSLDNDHSLDAYTEVLELLLSDPNVTVKTLLE